MITPLLGRRLLSSASSILQSLGIDNSQPVNGAFDGKTFFGNGPVVKSINPSTGETLAEIKMASVEDYKRISHEAVKAHKEFGHIPAPKRGEIVRQIGNRLRDNIVPLGQLVSLEMGKIQSEGIGEVQEAIDIADFACGLSRSLSGKVIPSERPYHTILEQYNPLLGPAGIITAFNFPVAVHSWNAAISLVCGNGNIWKPSESANLVAIATTQIMQQVLKENEVNPALLSLACGTKDVGSAMVDDGNLGLISFTGSTQVGRSINMKCASTFQKCILELGGNNMSIVMPDADLSLVLPSIVFNSVGTAGQRCTSQRRLLLHQDVYDTVVSKTIESYKNVKIGDPLDPNVLMGPLHNSAALLKYQETIENALSQGGKILAGGKALEGNFVLPTIIEIDLKNAPVAQDEAFVPILFVDKFTDLDQAIEINNQVKQGLSSSIFTKNINNLFKWIGPNGSDCGIVNLNTSTSGAEIGGLFGGNKETGWGRESGSEAWKQYTRVSTCTLNHSDQLPLAQGLSFDL